MSKFPQTMQTGVRVKSKCFDHLDIRKEYEIL